MKQETVFWQLLNNFVVIHEYRILHISPDHKEVWLEGLENKQAPIIRLYRYNLDWSTWLQRDIENASTHVRNFKKQLRKSKLKALNIYVSEYPPVDDWEFMVKTPYEKDKTELHTIIVHGSNIQHACQEISNIAGREISADDEIILDELGIHQLKQTVLNSSYGRVKKEKDLFQYGKPLFTFVFIVLHLIFFYLLETNGGSENPETLVKYGAKYNPAILEGEWWRFFTPILLHIGFLHLFLNTLALYYLGAAVERIYGNIRFLFIYLFAGFAGSLASFVYTPSLAAGASGAIFGCFGALLFVGMVYPKLFLRTMGMNIIVLIGINLSIGFAIPGIDNAGHIGGLVGGFLAAAIVHLPKHVKPIPRIVGLVLAVSLSLYFLDYGYNNENVYTVVMQAETLIQQEEYDQAYEILTQVEDEQEKVPEILFYLSFIDIKKGRYLEAKEHLEKVTAISPEFDEAHYNLALVYLELDELEMASASVERAIEIDSTGENYLNLRTEINRYLESE